jgi:hypothetical protein
MKPANALTPKGARVYMDPINIAGDEWHYFEVSYDECVRLVKMCKGRSLFIRFGWRSPSGTNEIEVSGQVLVSKREMLRCLEYAYSESLRGIARIRVTICNTCFFVGGV